MNQVIDTIIQRRSIRRYSDRPISDEDLTLVLDAGRWAPSGLNNQPWRFCIIRNRDILEKLSALTSYSRIIKESNVCIAVYFHVPSGYNRDKDLMGIGACIENMLLAAKSLGIGSAWIGEILAKKEAVSAVLEIDADHELVAVVALGYPAEEPPGRRKKLETFILKILN